jgi:hypothetical protein
VSDEIKVIKTSDTFASFVDHRKVLGWLQDNGISPQDVPLGSEIEIEDGEIHFTKYQRDADGNLLHDGEEPFTEEESVPLAVPWEE